MQTRRQGQQVMRRQAGDPARIECRQVAGMVGLKPGAVEPGDIGQIDQIRCRSVTGDEVRKTGAIQAQ